MKKKILVVEDNQLNYRLAEYILTQSGYAVEWACNGKECLDMIQQSGYAGILMDVHMPELNGIAATKIIRQTYSQELLPIIGVSADEVTINLDDLIQAGMNGHVSKPYQIETLLAKIHSFIAEGAATQPLSEETNKPVRPETAAATEWLDFTKVLKQSHGDLSLLRKTAPLLRKTTREVWLQIDQALITSDHAALLSHLHRLKGTIGAFTTEGPFQTIGELEELVAKNAIMEATTLLPDLKKSIDDLDGLLQQHLS